MPRNPLGRHKERLHSEILFLSTNGFLIAKLLPFSQGLNMWDSRREFCTLNPSKCTAGGMKEEAT